MNTPAVVLIDPPSPPGHMNELNRNPAYRAAKATLDAVMAPFEQVFFHAGAAILKATMPHTRRGAATVVPVKNRVPIGRART